MHITNRIIGKYLVGAALGFFAGVIAYYYQPVQWKGQVLIKVGQISQNHYSVPLEPLTTVVERLKSRSFIKSAAERANREEIKTLLNSDEGAGMSIRPVRNGDAIEIVVVAGSSGLVQNSLDAVVAELKFKHDTLLNDMLADSSRELMRLDSEIDLLSKRLLAATERPHQGGRTMAGLLVIAIQGALEKKMNQASVLRESVSSFNIRPTSQMESVSVTERHLISSLWRICLAGALIGVIFTALLIRLKK